MCEQFLVTDDFYRGRVRTKTPIQQQEQWKSPPAYRDLGMVLAVPPGDTARAAGDKPLAAPPELRICGGKLQGLLATRQAIEARVAQLRLRERRDGVQQVRHAVGG